MSETTSTRTAQMTHAVAIDTKLAEMWTAYWAVADRTAPHAAQITLDRKMVRAGYDHDGHIAARIAVAQAKIDAIMAEAAPLADAARAYNEANYEGWTRFWTVQDGHIHRPACHTLRPTTRVGWTPSLSGQTEAEAVVMLGPTLCTHCFPTAPAEWTRGADAKPGMCTGGGTYDWEQAAKDAGEKPRYGQRYQRCPHCNLMQSITSTGKLRAHKAGQA